MSGAPEPGRTVGSIRIGNGAGFWGDNLDAPIRLAEKGALDFLTLEYLAELTLSILAHQRRLDPDAGFVGDFPATIARLIPILKAQPRLRIVTNAGGLNPQACARATAKLLADAGMGGEKIAWVSGDDLIPRMGELRMAGEGFRHFDSGEEPQTAFVSANAYLGARPIADALNRGARIVITGRVADASLTVGPAMHTFQWSWSDWEKLAVASAAGHLIECGAQVTGGLVSRWKTVPDYATIGYPIAILTRDGQCRITKPVGTGGIVNRETVTGQLLYEIGDPRRYHTPDVTLDFTDMEVEEETGNVVRVMGAKGFQPPNTLKVSCAYENGFSAKGDLTVCGHDAAEKARVCGEIILERVRLAGFSLSRRNVELVGTGASMDNAVPDGLHEVVLRISIWDRDKKAVERFCREFSPIITSGPPGVTGYTGSRPRARPVLSYWPTTVSRDRVPARVEVREAVELAAMPGAGPDSKTGMKAGRT
ncbi:MAG: DUF1446 domain-containing protein [Fibrobacterota bacterium]|nr:DUF1446 domain-containing protein [Fibrobacterota bacterium]